MFGLPPAGMSIVFVKHRSKLEAGVLVVLACVAIPFLIGHVYGTNDEALFRLIAERHLLADDLSEYLVFINTLVGRALKWLYGLAPDWPWLDLLTQVIVAVSAIVLFSAARQIPHRLARNSLTLALVLIVAIAAASPHFTQTAALAAAAGLTLIGPAPHAPQKHAALTKLAAGITLFVIGGPYTSSSAQLLFILWVPVLALVHSKVPPRSRLQVAGLASLVAFGLNVAAQAYDESAYAKYSEWASFRAHNDSRIDVVDYARFARPVCGKRMDQLIARAGWTRNDFRMLQSFMFSNPAIFSAERTRVLASSLKPCTARTGAYVWQYLKWRVSNVPYLMMPMVLVLAIGLSTNTCRGMAVKTGAYALLAVFIWLSTEVYFKPLPARVTFTFTLAAWGFAASAAQFSRVGRTIKTGCWASIVVALLVGALAFNIGW